MLKRPAPATDVAVAKKARPDDSPLPAGSTAPLLTGVADPLRLERETMAPDWFSVLEKEMREPYFAELKRFLAAEVQSGTKVYPPPEDIYTWSRLIPLKKVKVVILGQDPYHGPNQAHGLAFSVRQGIAVPASLRNIYEELSREYPDFKAPRHGYLEGWAKQGVLMLNSSLTVRASQAGSHANRGWEKFTRAVIRALVAAQSKTAGDSALLKPKRALTSNNGAGNRNSATSTPKLTNQKSLDGWFKKKEPEAKKEVVVVAEKSDAVSALSNGAATVSAATKESDVALHKGQQAAPVLKQASLSLTETDKSETGPTKTAMGIVFLVWGRPAEKMINEAKVGEFGTPHLVLRSPHPSPLSAHRGFFGNGHFKGCNNWLENPQRYGPGGGIDWGKL